LAKARLAQAWLYENLGRLNDLEAAVKEAKQLYESAHDRKGVSDATTMQAIALELTGDYQSARQKYVESLSILRETGNEHGAANENDNLGDVYLYWGIWTLRRKVTVMRLQSMKACATKTASRLPRSDSETSLWPTASTRRGSACIKRRSRFAAELVTAEEKLLRFTASDKSCAWKAIPRELGKPNRMPAPFFAN